MIHNLQVCSDTQRYAIWPTERRAREMWQHTTHKSGYEDLTYAVEQLDVVVDLL